MSRKSNLVHQFLKELQKETKFSESKSQAKADNRKKAAENREKYEQIKGIYSYKTYKDYAKAVKTFAAYVTKNHSEVKTMEQAICVLLYARMCFLRSQSFKEKLELWN